jgi:competence protein ComEC
MSAHVADVAFVDVGQGHATVVLGANHAAMVVDCPRSGADAVNAILDDADALELAVLVTHRDLDHCGGIREVMRHRRASALYMNTAWAVAPRGPIGSKVRTVLQSILDQADLDGTELLPAVRGDVRQLGVLGWTVLSPPYAWVAEAALKDTTNRASVVLRLDLGGTRVLITGDADQKVIELLLTAEGELASEILLLPHHGATVGKLSDLVAAVAPEVAVVSAGRSAGIHPTESTLMLLKAAPCAVMCTQVNRHCHAPDISTSRCAGTIRMEFTTAGYAVLPSLEDHLERVVRFNTPRCVVKPIEVN